MRATSPLAPLAAPNPAKAAGGQSSLEKRWEGAVVRRERGVGQLLSPSALRM